MKITPFWASVALLVPQALAAVTGSTTGSATSTTSTAATASCTATLITELCSYPEPDLAFALASSGKADCWEYCNAHSPCSFVIFDAGNPNTGTGTCWLYPGETYNATKGSSDCTNPTLSVYDKPVCSGGSTTTTTAGACTATATPSAIASVCGYPTPPDDCFSDCSASTGAPDCLSQCAKADSCSYVVFNPGSGSTSPYASGSCWMYPNGTYNAADATTCSGDPDQFVYNNVCPKASASASTLSSSVEERSKGTGTAGSTLNSTTSAATSTTTSSGGSALVAFSVTYPLALGVAVFMWQAL